MRLPVAHRGFSTMLINELKGTDFTETLHENAKVELGFNTHFFLTKRTTLEESEKYSEDPLI